MPLLTDIYTPQELTGYARGHFDAIEATNNGLSLAAWLPNRTTIGSTVKVRREEHGLVEAAEFRAYDAEPTTGGEESVEEFTLELPALSRNYPISEYRQLVEQQRLDTGLERAAEKYSRIAVQAIADKIEYMRGVVLQTGAATINDRKFKTRDDFARDPRLTVTAAEKWTTDTVSRLDALRTWIDVYRTVNNGQRPGALVAGSAAYSALLRGDEFQTQLLNGGARPATPQQVEDTLAGYRIPRPLEYTRQIRLGKVATPVVDPNTIVFLPAPGDPFNEAGTELGGTVWGETLTGRAVDWAIPDDELAGIVCGLWQNDKVPAIAEVISDAIALPLLGNANLSMAIKVL
ncbi:major capsid protein [Kocuria sp. KH4]